MRIAAALLAVFAASSLGGPRAEQPQTDDQKTLYALGLAISQSVSRFGLSEGELAFVQEGLADGVLGNDPRVELAEFGPKIQALLETRMSAAADKEREAGQALVERAAAEPDSVETDSGSIFVPMEVGKGASPEATDQVKVHYHGTLSDGKVFDSSRQRGEPATFSLNQVIPCFSEGIREMKVGGKSRLVCPPDTAYGDQGKPPVIPPGATLTFEVELLGIGEDAEGS